LDSKLSHVFGKAGMEVLNGLMAGKSLDEIVNESHSRALKERRGELEKVVRVGLDEEDAFVLQRWLHMVRNLDEELKELDARISMLVADKEKEVKNISKIPCVAKVSASSILAEIGYAKRFADGKKITSGAGLKILCIMHRLLVTGEEHVKESFMKNVKVKCTALSKLHLEEMVRILTGAGLPGSGSV
jgi:hypothetical protein